MDKINKQIQNYHKAQTYAPNQQKTHTKNTIKVSSHNSRMPAPTYKGNFSNTSNGSYGGFHKEWRPTTLGQLPKSQKNKKHMKFIEDLPRVSDEYGFYAWEKVKQDNENKEFMSELERNKKNSRASGLLDEEKGWANTQKRKESFLPPINNNKRDSFKTNASFSVTTGPIDQSFRLPDIKHINIQLTLADDRQVTIRADPNKAHFT
ncbi:unnamed protein product [Owenia fusiformis]|uniref:Uncharacterized protein n=1 Tax=Owenia fusiformis TaxID=6347 RepID=A0A8J1Y1H1_OWEFU|nr:unnamed protein product [Owenia fusiformis]